MLILDTILLNITLSPIIDDVIFIFRKHAFYKINDANVNVFIKDMRNVRIFIRYWYTIFSHLDSTTEIILKACGLYYIMHLLYNEYLKHGKWPTIFQLFYIVFIILYQVCKHDQSLLSIPLLHYYVEGNTHFCDFSYFAC